MKRWALIVAGLYCLVLAALTVPVIMLALSDVHLKNAVSTYSEWSYWTWLLVMFLGQVTLLAVPVKIENRKPVSRQSLLPTVLASGFMMAVLMAGAVAALYEFAFTVERDWGKSGWWCLSGIVLLTWCIWSLVFMRLGKSQPPADVVSRQCKTLFKGSVLELLIAVPTHIVARHREQCCAGFMTFIGLVCGLSVMLFSFGPAVFFLFTARWKRLHPPA